MNVEHCAKTRSFSPILIVIGFVFSSEFNAFTFTYCIFQCRRHSPSVFITANKDIVVC